MRQTWIYTRKCKKMTKKTNLNERFLNRNHGEKVGRNLIKILINFIQLFILEWKKETNKRQQNFERHKMPEWVRLGTVRPPLP